MADILSEYDRRRRRDQVVPAEPDADPDPDAPTGTMPTLDAFRDEFASYSPGSDAEEDVPDRTPEPVRVWPGRGRAAEVADGTDASIGRHPKPPTSIPPLPAVSVARGVKAPLPASGDADPWSAPADADESLPAPRDPHLAGARRSMPPEPEFLAREEEQPEPEPDRAVAADEPPARAPVPIAVKKPESVSAPLEGSGGDAPTPAPFSEYDALKKALGEQDAAAAEPNYSWISKAGEDINAAFMRRKPNYDVAGELDAQAAARRAAPGQRFRQEQELQGARERDRDRAPLDGSYLDRLGAPHGLNKAQLKDFMDRRLQAANVKHLEQEPKLDKTLGLYAAWKSENPNGTMSEFLKLQGETSATVQAAGVKSKSAAEVQGLRNQLAAKELEWKTADAKQRYQLQVDIQEIKAALAREEETGRNTRATAANASHERVAGQNLAAAEDRFKAGQSFKERGEIQKSVPDQLVDATESVKQLKAAGPQSLADVGWSDRILKSLPWGIGEQFVDPKNLATMSKEEAFKKFQVRMETGLAMTVPEIQEANTRFGLRAFSDPSLFKEMMNWYEALGNKKLAQRQAGFSEEGLSRAKAAGGTVSETALNSARGLPPIEPGFVRVSKDDETRDIPEADLAEATADGYKRVQ